MNIDARHEVVLQSYLNNPLLWRGRKLQYRCYCVWRGRRCYLYAGAMAQVCALPYEPPSGDMAPEQHVTNVSCNVDSSHFVPERPVQDLRQSHPEAFEAVVTALRSLSRACAPALAPSSNRFELVGVDVLLEDLQGVHGLRAIRVQVMDEPPEGWDPKNAETSLGIG